MVLSRHLAKYVEEVTRGAVLPVPAPRTGQRSVVPLIIGYCAGAASIALYMVYQRWNPRLSALINIADIYFSLKPSRYHLTDSNVEEINQLRKKHVEIPIGPIIPMRSTQHIGIPGPDGNVIPITIHTPPHVSEKCPVVVYLHGGGFVVGNSAFYDPVTTFVANATNSIVFSVDYRKAPENKFPCGINDCLAAVRWVHAHATDMNCDAGRIAVMGDSAGGNLAIIVSIELWDIVFMVVPIYPVITFGMFSESKVRNADAPILKALSLDWYNLRYFRSAADLMDSMANPLMRSTKELARVPYTHVITAEFDVLLDDGIEYVRRLQQCGAENVSYKNYENTVHGFFGAALLTHGPEALQDVCDLFNAHFAHFARRIDYAQLLTFKSTTFEIGLQEELHKQHSSPKKYRVLH
jgi:acetyl esterase